MKNNYCGKFVKYTKFKNPKISYIWSKKLIFLASCAKCGRDLKIYIFKKQKTIETLKIFCLIYNTNIENLSTQM